MTLVKTYDRTGLDQVLAEAGVRRLGPGVFVPPAAGSPVRRVRFRLLPWRLRRRVKGHGR